MYKRLTIYCFFVMGCLFLSKANSGFLFIQEENREYEDFEQGTRYIREHDIDVYFGNQGTGQNGGIRFTTHEANIGEDLGNKLRTALDNNNDVSTITFQRVDKPRYVIAAINALETLRFYNYRLNNIILQAHGMLSQDVENHIREVQTNLERREEEIAREERNDEREERREQGDSDVSEDE